jgi:hypothetical protein
MQEEKADIFCLFESVRMRRISKRISGNQGSETEGIMYYTSFKD